MIDDQKNDVNRRKVLKGVAAGIVTAGVASSFFIRGAWAQEIHNDLNAKEKWEQYAEFWTMVEADRKARIAQIATPDVTYTDPNVSISGAEAFSDHIGQFQKDIPGVRFVITEAFEHHQRTLAHWDMLGADGSLMVKGTSFANLSEDGKFSSFTGFFGGG